jgi:FkbM family methyltransferase
MLIHLHQLVSKYNLNIKGILHIGAHTGEERSVYDYLDIDPIIWIEADPQLATNLSLRFKEYPNNHVIGACISDKIGVEEFHRTNNYASSSILPLGTHEWRYPKIKVVDKFNIECVTIDSLFDLVPFVGEDRLNFINLDIQGAELKALKGAKENLHRFDYIYTEFNTEEVYKGCALLPELDKYLSDYKRVETEHTGKGWGDCFYVKKELL